MTDRVDNLSVRLDQTRRPLVDFNQRFIKRYKGTRKWACQSIEQLTIL